MKPVEKGSVEEHEERELWRWVFVTRSHRGHSTASAESDANAAVEAYRKRFRVTDKGAG